LILARFAAVSVRKVYARRPQGEEAMAMTRERVTELLHEAVYSVIRRRRPLPGMEEFLDLPLRGVLPQSSPRAWPSFWKDALVETIAAVFRREGYWIDGLDTRIFLRWNRKMRSIRDWIAERLMPLEEDAGGSAGEGHGANRTLVILLALLPLLFGPSASRAETAIDSTAAVLARVSAMDPQAGRFEYAILLAFKSDKGRAVELPIAAVRDPRHYRLHSDCDSAAVSIEHIVERGARVREDCTSAAVLYADLDPSCAYVLTMTLPGSPETQVKVSRAEEDLPDLAKGFVRFVSFVDQHLSGTVDVRTLGGEQDRDALPARGRRNARRRPQRPAGAERARPRPHR
jgi:hypothetical protein